MRGLQGTRQKSGRNFGIRPAPITRRVMGKKKQNTDYTKNQTPKNTRCLRGRQNTNPFQHHKPFFVCALGNLCFVWVLCTVLWEVSHHRVSRDGGCNKSLPGDCLSKTQLPANSQEDV